MFIKKNFYFWILIMFLLLNSNNFAQDTLNYRHYNFGFGVTLLKDYTFYFPIFITNNIKMEPELYYRRDSDPYHDQESTELEIGTGLFYSRHYSQLNIYSGLRAVYSFYNSWDKYEGIELGPTLGGEYFLVCSFQSWH